MHVDHSRLKKKNHPQLGRPRVRHTHASTDMVKFAHCAFRLLLWMYDIKSKCINVQKDIHVVGNQTDHIISRTREKYTVSDLSVLLLLSKWWNILQITTYSFA